MTDPAYTGLQREDIPAVEADEGRVRIELISGAWQGKTGAHESLTGVAMTVLRFAPGGRVSAPAPQGRNVFLYAVAGTLDVAGTAVPAFNLAELADDGGAVVLTAGAEGAVALFGHAAPLHEPVVAHGPFVMNTREEIAAAVRDYQAGRFGTLS
jgi:redox-sensitive bicupin YhaK (pirin superfamily)